jgi:predicted DNA-binding WGR domain protein
MSRTRIRGDQFDDSIEWDLLDNEAKAELIRRELAKRKKRYSDQKKYSTDEEEN